MRILIAEDDFTSRITLVEVLKKHGHEVVATVNGAEAWQAMQEPDAPRLVVLDWMMPEMDGLAVCRRIRSLQTDRPPHIILLTCKNEKKDVMAGFEAGVDEYLTKPFEPGELLARLAVGQRVVELRADLLEKNAALDHAVAQLRMFGSVLTQAEDRERRRLAVWLHDDFQQYLVAATMKVGVINQDMSRDDHARAIQEAVSLLEELLGRSRALTTDLYPPILLGGGLVPCLQWLAERMNGLHGLKVTVAADKSLSVPEARVTLVFHVVREVLFNVIKHAGVKEAKIGVTLDSGSLRVVIEDQGSGFVPGVLASPRSRGGFGLFNLRERLNYAGGTLEVVSQPGRGTRVSVMLPV